MFVRGWRFRSSGLVVMSHTRFLCANPRSIDAFYVFLRRLPCRESNPGLSGIYFWKPSILTIRLHGNGCDIKLQVAIKIQTAKINVVLHNLEFGLIYWSNCLLGGLYCCKRPSLPSGIEPLTSRLTVARSTNWAKGEFIKEF